MPNIMTGFKDVYFTCSLIIGNVYYEKVKMVLSLATFFQQAAPLPAAPMASKDMRFMLLIFLKTLSCTLKKYFH